MKKGILSPLSILVLGVMLLPASCCYAQFEKGFGDDIDPANLPVGFTWKDNGLAVNLALMDDKGKVTTTVVRRYFGCRNFIAKNSVICRDQNGKDYPRWYTDVEYPDKDLANNWRITTKMRYSGPKAPPPRPSEWATQVQRAIAITTL